MRIKRNESTNNGSTDSDSPTLSEDSEDNEHRNAFLNNGAASVTPSGGSQGTTSTKTTQKARSPVTRTILSFLINHKEFVSAFAFSGTARGNDAYLDAYARLFDDRFYISILKNLTGESG